LLADGAAATALEATRSCVDVGSAGVCARVDATAVDRWRHRHVGAGVEARGPVVVTTTRRHDDAQREENDASAVRQHGGSAPAQNAVHTLLDV